MYVPFVAEHPMNPDLLLFDTREILDAHKAESGYGREKRATIR